MEEILMSCKDISLKLSDVSIIENISLSLRKGEFHLFIGENGAGKTSLINIMSGVYPYGTYLGTLTYKDSVLRMRSPKDALKHNIVTVHQNCSLFENLTIAENLYANFPFPSTLKKMTSLEKLVKKADRFFSEHGFSIDSSLLISDCSTATRRKIELLRLYLTEPELLILDEPVAVVSDYDLDYFMDLIAYFKKKGVTILCISHKYQAFAELIDRFSIFHERGLSCTISQNDYQNKQIRDLILSDFCQSRYPKITVEKGSEVFCAEHLCTPDMLRDVSFSLYRGEILGIFGRLGSGNTVLAKSLFGLEPLCSGNFYIDRLPARISSPQEAINLGLAYITDERVDYGLFHNLDLLENVYSIKGNNYQQFWTRTKSEYKLYRKYANKLNMELSPTAIPDCLSGGEQQKLILMRWLMSPARIFILNEPTQSIDIPSKIDIYNMFNDLVLKGASILIFSSNLEELAGICDRILFIRQGTISGEMSRGESLSLMREYI